MLGETLALSAAFVWALSIILFKKSEALSAQGMNLFKNLVAMVLLLITMPIVGAEFDWDRPTADWVALIISGVLGISIADTLIFGALRRLGPGLLAVVDCAYAPTIVLMSVFALHEQIGPMFAVGAVLVVGGVLTAVGEQLQPDVDRSVIPAGVAMGLAGIIGMAIGVVLAKPVLEDGHLVEVTLVRVIAGILGQMVWIAVDPSQRDALEALRPSPAWKTLIPGSILGSYIAMLLWLGGFKWADASTASVLNQMATVFTIILARVLLKEHVSGRRAAGAGAAVVGAILVITRT
ncbi:MAG: drug/metabolite transporter (DMT)-like permease [Myxococcota bacterium]|jgi:drug/metabolite transporter (DMT)-like permease